MRDIESSIEFGANIGMNLRALKLLRPGQQQFAIEINANAAKRLREILPAENVFNESILEYEVKRTFDLVLIKGVLIHINPEALPVVYEKLYNAAGKYLLIGEYYSTTPVAIDYRGHKDRLYKRDFCGEMLDRYSDLELLDYGFDYHRDPNYPQDDGTWFLVRKKG